MAIAAKPITRAELDRIELRARALRAQAARDGAQSLKNWFRGLFSAANTGSAKTA